MADETLFERIISGEIPSHGVAKGDGWYAFLDINPRRPGHTLVVPNKGVSHLAKLSANQASRLIQGVQEVQRKLGIVFKTTDFSVVLHDGGLAGQEVPHVHFHVIPRNANDGGKSMMAMWPNSPTGLSPDHASLSSLSSKLMEV